MYIKVRPMTGGDEVALTVSKLTKIEELRLQVQKHFSVAPEQQRLFFQGKQLEDGHTIFDYNVNINDVIQLLVRQFLTESTNKNGCKDQSAPVQKKTGKKKQSAANDQQSKRKPEEAAKGTEHLASAKTSSASANSEASNELPATNGSEELVEESEYYKVGDLVDARHEGSWWEAELLSISRAPPNTSPPPPGELRDPYCYLVRFERYHYEEPSKVLLHELRPRAFKKLSLDDVKPGMKLLVNYNIDEPAQRGYWYHAEVESVVTEHRKKLLVVTLLCEQESLSGCLIAFTDELLCIPDHVPLSQRLPPTSAVKRESAPTCATCQDSRRRKCYDCGCCCCGRKEDPEKQLMCDECDKPYHIYCLQPPLDAVPDVQEWFCPSCKNDETEIVRAGEKLKQSNKRAKMPSQNSNSSRDWGKGFACVGRSKECTIVPSDHFGHIPGVEVGSQWLYRIQASEAGVHRPPVSGIHGRADAGAYSVVLAGGYEDDEDNGEEFTYTGAGGRDLSGNKRTAQQSCDQTLNKTNRALALNCNCKISEKGGDAGDDWRKGKPLRVLRSYKGSKHSQYAPTEGIRYDGLYKVCRYWQEAGKSGFKVWRYLIRRDDPTPAPWTPEGKDRIAKLGLVMQYPADHPGLSSASKRKLNESQEDGDVGDASRKKARLVSYDIADDVKAAIAADTNNQKLWAACQEAAKQGHQNFVDEVQSQFSCICCQELLLLPVTTDCLHNVCKACLLRSFKAEVFVCPACRKDLGQSYKAVVNKDLSAALCLIFPGYRGTSPH